MRSVALLAIIVAVFSPPIYAEHHSVATWNIDARRQFNVYSFTTGDYPAMFLIVGGISLVLILATIYIVVGMMSIDPGKDSIVYRMTTTRMKRD